ncbi:Iron(3+)-hydroxamate import ATP-binding protein FhuC [Austwickia sp. TVS 96-490-7B]|uniref:ABC transporter ATP-binding protein n=1 Tax=Austwickia sp. TVS 96-490-7B TaxID=2830843 RepID=UPI001C55B07A|nr:ABC transporter ATP-binding protein [Austwickia sp. TVS 96-490-7B]MBW3087081.1 Iron(3+)-hydroxamate import ATP-binding protein FhuC [Austwickia sp. TVS 96-490-7B]
MIIARNISVDRSGHRVLDSVSLATKPDRTIGIIGPNGAGKSTLLRTLYRSLAVASGEIHVDGDQLESLSRRDVARRISVVAQVHGSALPLPVRDSVALGRLSHRGLAGYGDNDDRERVDRAIAQVGLEGFENRLTTELSGGEMQRVLIARAIVQDATHLLLDEPTNHLDIFHQYQVLDLVRDLRKTCVVVLHDLNLASQYCDELVLLDRGRIVSSGRADDVLTAERITEVYRVRCEVLHHSNGQRHIVYSSVAQEQADTTATSGKVAS